MVLGLYRFLYGDLSNIICYALLNYKMREIITHIDIYRSEGLALTGYDIPGCVDDGAWMLWENSSAAAAVAHLGLWGGGENSAFPEIKSQKMRPQAHFCDLIS